jgi:hypothetical protein
LDVIGDCGVDDLKEAPSWSVLVKHGVEIKVRPWSVSIDGIQYSTRTVPRKIKVFERVQERLTEGMEDARKKVEGTLSDIASAESLALRLTVLVEAKGFLVCTPLRVLRGHSNSSGLPVSGTRYPLATNSFWGLPAHIFLGKPVRDGKAPKHEGDPVYYSLKLPEWKEGGGKGESQNRENYCRILEKKWGIPESEVRKLTRKARAYMGVRILGIDGNPQAVLMVDSMDPLKALAKANARIYRKRMSDVLQDCASYIAPYLHIRYSP